MDTYGKIYKKISTCLSLAGGEEKELSTTESKNRSLASVVDNQKIDKISRKNIVIYGTVVTFKNLSSNSYQETTSTWINFCSYYKFSIIREFFFFILHLLIASASFVAIFGPENIFRAINIVIQTNETLFLNTAVKKSYQLLVSSLTLG